MNTEFTCELLRRCGRERLRRQDGAESSEEATAGGAWDELVERFGPMLSGWVSYFLYLESGLAADPAEVEELVQELYCRLLVNDGRRLRGFRGRHPGQAHQYLRCTAARLVQDHVRRKQALKRRTEVRRMRPLAREQPIAEQVIDPASDPETRLLCREQLELLFDCCRRLTASAFRARNLRILRLALIEGCTSEEIVERLGDELSPSAVDTVISRMRTRLARHGLRIAARGGSRAPA